MNENEKDLQQTPEFDLDDIMKEFAPGEEEPLDEALLEELLPEAAPQAQEASEEAPTEVSGETMRIYGGRPAREQPDLLGDTVPIRLHTKAVRTEPLSDTIRLDTIQELPREEAPKAEQPKTEDFGDTWQPSYEQPMGEYVPAQPIIFHPRSRLRELKRKLVAGPERRYYELNEQGLGKLQAAMFLTFLTVLLSAGTTVMYAMGMVSQERLKLMVFCQLFSMMIAALLGSFQLIDGLADLFRGRFSPNTILVFTFLSCCADGVLCLQEQRIPCCAAFTLQVLMSLWSAYHRRSTEMAMMDTLRKANHLTGIKAVPNYYDGCTGLLRGEAELEDFWDTYRRRSRPEKVLGWYCLAALAAGIGIGVAAWQLHGSVSFGIQALSVSLLAAVPVTTFITLTRPMAILEHRLHKLGAVLCGWKGVVGLSRRAVFPVTNEDLFPVGSCKLNGVKFYGDRDPDQIVAYCAALVNADGGGLVPLFDHLLTSRNGRHYDAGNFRAYSGGIGGEVCGEPVLMGTAECLKELGVEIPAGNRVSQAVYAAIDGEFCGVFAVTYAKLRGSATGIRTLCAYHKLRPLLISGEFTLTESFIRSRFNVNTRRLCFVSKELQEELQAVEPDREAPGMALVTGKGLAPFAFAVTGAHSLRTASWVGVTIHLIGGILGIGIMAVLTVLGARELLTPVNLFLYELAFLIPGLLLTEWTRAI